jgi:hypothetical protein
VHVGTTTGVQWSTTAKLGIVYNSQLALALERVSGRRVKNIEININVVGSIMGHTQGVLLFICAGLSP